MFQFHLSFSSMNTAIVINPCPLSVQQNFLVRNEKKGKVVGGAKGPGDKVKLYILFRIYLAFASDFRKCLDLSLELRLGLL